MLKDFSEKCLRNIDPGNIYLWDWISAVEKSGGVLSGLKAERFDVGCKKQADFILQCTVWDKMVEVKWYLLNVYGAAQSDRKEAFLSKLASFCSKVKEPYIVGVTLI
jgi:hypothetical protein